MVVPSGFMVTGFNGGDFWANFPAGATVGGFVFADPIPQGEEDEIWEAEVVLVKKLASGRKAFGCDLDQVMTGSFLNNPSNLED